MRDLSYFNKIYVFTGFVDFRKQSYGLSVLVKEHFDLKPFEPKSLFIFTNRRKRAIKMLYWDLTGFALWIKSLETEHFKWPKPAAGERVMLTPRELRWLLDGVDLGKIKIHEPVTFSELL